MYATLDTLIERYGQQELVEIAPDGLDPPGIDTVRVDAALADAAATVDSYLQARYRLPLSSVPNILVRLSAEIARHALHDDHASERITDARDNAIRLLRDISTGKASLGISDTDEAAARPQGSAQIESAPARWRRDQSKGFV